MVNLLGAVLIVIALTSGLWLPFWASLPVAVILGFIGGSMVVSR